MRNRRWKQGNLREIGKSQKEGGSALTMFVNSMLPEKRLEFVPPRVKVPPGASSGAFGSFTSRARKNDISGDVV